MVFGLEDETGGGSTIELSDEGVALGTVDRLDFLGTGVLAARIGLTGFIRIDTPLPQIQLTQQDSTVVVQTVGTGAWLDVPGTSINLNGDGSYNIVWNTTINPGSNSDTHWRLAIDGVPIGTHLVHTAAGNFAGLAMPLTLCAFDIPLLIGEVVTAQVILNSGVNTSDVFEQRLAITQVL